MVEQGWSLARILCLCLEGSCLASRGSGFPWEVRETLEGFCIFVVCLFHFFLLVAGEWRAQEVGLMGPLGHLGAQVSGIVDSVSVYVLADTVA